MSDIKSNNPHLTGGESIFEGMSSKNYLKYYLGDVSGKKNWTTTFVRT